MKKAIEFAGPRITQTSVTVGSVRLSPRSGGGGFHGFVVGNPSGYSTPFAIKLGDARLEVDPASVFSDKIHIRSIAVTDPQVTLEGGLSDNNLRKILANIDSFTAGDKTASSNNGSRTKIQVDDFVLKGTKVDVKLTLLGGKAMSVSLPDIHLTNLGGGGDGLTPGELSKKVLGAIIEEVIPAVTAQVGKLGDLGKDLGKGAVDSARGTLDKAAGGFGDLLKKK